MDPLFQAISLFRRREFEGCADKCSEILAGHPYDQVGFTTAIRLAALYCMALLVKLAGCALIEVFVVCYRVGMVSTTDVAKKNLCGS